MLASLSYLRLMSRSSAAASAGVVIGVLFITAWHLWPAKKGRRRPTCARRLLKASNDINGKVRRRALCFSYGRTQLRLTHGVHTVVILACLGAAWERKKRLLV